MATKHRSKRKNVAARANSSGQGEARVITLEHQIDSAFFEDDWYTPKVLKLHPLKVSVLAGEPGQGAVECEILEGEWEHRFVHLSIFAEDVKAPKKNWNYGFSGSINRENGSGVSGTFDLEKLDRLIEALTTARAEAEKRGLFDLRSTPKSIHDVVVAQRSA